MGLFTSLEKTDKVRYKKVKEEGCVVTFSVEIPAAQVQDETHNYLLRLQQRAKIPGFRPGKAPLDLVKKEFTERAREDVLDGLIRKYVPEGMRELNLHPVAVPTVEDASYNEGKPARFQVLVEVPPQVIPKDYTKVAVRRKLYPASEEALAARLEELREANARLEKAAEEAIGKEHYAVIDYTGAKTKGEAELVDMSCEQVVNGLAEGLLGMARGETKDITVEINGKGSVLKVTVKEIKRKILPALDGEFAKDLGFNTVEELKAKLKNVMEDEGKAKSERELQQQIEQSLINSNHIPLPPSLVEAQLEHALERFRRQLLGEQGRWSDKQSDDLRVKLKPKAEDELRLSYLLPAIAQLEKIKASDEDLELELEKNLSAVEEAGKKEEVRKMFEERREAIADVIRDRKTMAFIRGKTIITEAA
ncbi:MAG: trigger factor [Elusimicrobia bacterium RIFCSPHIGHO2_02_FULL_57_9]|nr:MAG: trigger factor [Elusimicrobia bacterium RIFCSPHIGHO2_02_FULL_57_9]